MNPPDYQELIQQLLDKEISQDDFQRLEQELRTTIRKRSPLTEVSPPFTAVWSDAVKCPWRSVRSRWSRWSR